MVFGTWDLNFGAWKILRYHFQDMVFKTWDLNFGAWIFTLAVSKTETWKLLGPDFQNVGSQFWDLDFTQGLHTGPSEKGEWRKKKGRHGRIVSDHHGHPLVIIYTTYKETTSVRSCDVTFRGKTGLSVRWRSAVESACPSDDVPRQNQPWNSRSCPSGLRTSTDRWQAVFFFFFFFFALFRRAAQG
jgi:hypothetical protein